MKKIILVLCLLTLSGFSYSAMATECPEELLLEMKVVKKRSLILKESMLKFRLSLPQGEDPLKYEEYIRMLEELNFCNRRIDELEMMGC